jgi:putative tricarboxylic transport membrane protein
LAACIFVLCVTGSFASRSNVFDVWLALGFGALGYLMHVFHFSVPSFILGLILGSMIETHLRQALIISGGSFGVFVTSPIALAFLCAAGLSVAYAIWQGARIRALAQR